MKTSWANTRNPKQSIRLSNKFHCETWNICNIHSIYQLHNKKLKYYLCVNQNLIRKINSVQFHFHLLLCYSISLSRFFYSIFWSTTSSTINLIKDFPSGILCAPNNIILVHSYLVSILRARHTKSIIINSVVYIRYTNTYTDIHHLYEWWKYSISSICLNMFCNAYKQWCRFIECYYKLIATDEIHRKLKHVISVIVFHSKVYYEYEDEKNEDCGICWWQLD